MKARNSTQGHDSFLMSIANDLAFLLYAVACQTHHALDFSMQEKSMFMLDHRVPSPVHSLKPRLPFPSSLLPLLFYLLPTPCLLS